MNHFPTITTLWFNAASTFDKRITFLLSDRIQIFDLHRLLGKCNYFPAEQKSSSDFDES